MNTPRFLIVDGNTQERNAAMRQIGGQLSGERYAIEIARMFPDAMLDIVYPADADVELPDGMSLGDYDGMVIGGSSLRVFDDEPPVKRQIDLMRASLDAGMPVLGSCWGLQVAAVATGGDVAPSPNGREVGIARRVTLNAAGAAHPFFAGKARVFDTPCIHYDEVTALPSGCEVLAANDHSPVQAAVIPHGAGLFWGVQYHPEFDMPHVANLYDRYRDAIVGGGFFDDMAALDAYIDDVRTLADDPSRADLRAELDLGDDVLDADTRCLEIRNWVEFALSRR